MNSPRVFHTATALSDGTVLITGGASKYDANLNPNALDSAEIYNPGNGVFTATAGKMHTARQSHSAALLADGTVLIAGGVDTSGNVLQNAEIYNPVTSAFAVTGSMSHARQAFTATTLTTGMVLVAGGTSNASAELYDPATGKFSATGSLQEIVAFQTATLRNDGTVLIVGGQDHSGNGSAAAEIYDPKTGIFTLVGGMKFARTSNTETLLPSGAVLVAGGFGVGLVTLNSTEIYPSTGAAPADQRALLHQSSTSFGGQSKSAARIRKLVLSGRAAD
jgi:hypothetical protein